MHAERRHDVNVDRIKALYPEDHVRTYKDGLEGLLVIRAFLDPTDAASLLHHIDARPWGGCGLAYVHPSIHARVDATAPSPPHGHSSRPNPEMRRRTQHYGHVFSYRHRCIDTSFPATPMPSFLRPVLASCARLVALAHGADAPLAEPDDATADPTTPPTPFTPDLLIVNEYTLGQGIMPHVDSPTLFGPVILSLSLLSPCVMHFRHVATGRTQTVLLGRCSPVRVVVDRTRPRLTPLPCPALPRVEPRSLLVMTGEARYAWTHMITKLPRDETDDGDVIERGRRVSLTFRQLVQTNSD